MLRLRARGPGASGERGDDFAFEQLDSAAVVGRLGEVVDGVGHAAFFHVGETFDELFGGADGEGLWAQVLAAEGLGSVRADVWRDPVGQGWFIVAEC